MSVHHPEVRRIVGRQESGGQGRLALEAGQIRQGVEPCLVRLGRKGFSGTETDLAIRSAQEVFDPAALGDPLPADQDADVGLARLLVYLETGTDLVEDLIVVARRVVAAQGVEQTSDGCHVHMMVASALKG